MAYTVKNNTLDNTFEVWECDYETGREIMIVAFFDKKDATIVRDHFAYGGGFDGWTPDFIFQTAEGYLEKSPSVNISA